jgi:hypothetical protein
VNTVVVGDKLELSARLVHALVIAGLLFHLKLTELLLKCTYCVEGRLKADMEVACWEGWHLVTFGAAATLLLFYSLGYPLAVLVVLCRSRMGMEKEKAKGAEEAHFSLTKQPTLRSGRIISIADLPQAKVLSSFGVLLDDIRDSYFWWHCVQFLHNWCLTLLIVFNPAADVTLFCMAVLDLAIITFISIVKPFATPGDNSTALSFQLVAAVQSIVLLVAAMLLTLPVSGVNLPAWMEVPPPVEQNFWLTITFAAVPVLWLVIWLLAFASFTPVRELCYCCYKKPQAKTANLGKIGVIISKALFTANLKHQQSSTGPALELKESLDVESIASPLQISQLSGRTKSINSGGEKFFIPDGVSIAD